MAVFFRRRGLAETKTKWKKYSVAYSAAAAANVTVASHAGNNASTATSAISYASQLYFSAAGEPELQDAQTAVVSYNSYTNANQLKNRFWASGNTWYIGTGDNATRNTNQLGTVTYYAVYKKAKKITAWIAGDYIEDVEDENASAYPDNGPLGLYWYIKQ